MNPQTSNQTGRAPREAVDQIPARGLLEGLARLYQLVLVTDFDGRVVWMSNELTEICGGAHFRVGSDAQAILPQLPVLPKPEQVFTLRSNLRRQGWLSNAHVELAAHDGETIPVEVNILPISTPLEHRPFFVIIARREHTGQDAPALPTAAESELRSILDAAPDAMLSVDARGFVVYANAAAERMLATPMDQIVNRPVAALLHDAAELERLLASLDVGAEIADSELTLVRSDGSDVAVAASARSRQLADGSFAGTVLCMRDVGDRHRIAKDLHRKNAELEHCVNALAHDLRSPLVALLGFSRLLRQDYGAQLDATGAHFVDRIEQAGRTMEDLIHDLLELSRIGQPGERRALVDPKTVLSQLQAELKPRLDEGGIRLELPPNPPLVYCDRTRLYQVFSNLIGNAIDHMGSCDDPRIAVSIQDEGSCHHIEVRDSGRGIDGEHQDLVFDVFQSLGPASDGRRGTGIGLAIVKKIVETHGGKIWLDSERGIGAAFHLTLPHR